VVARVSASAGANQAVASFTIRVTVKAFQNIYVHCTGAGNLGTLTLS
jgi:hypothetical protein